MTNILGAKGRVLIPQKKAFVGNTIGLRIDALAVEANDSALKKSLRETICQNLNWTPVKLGRVLNNKDQPTTPQLVMISQLLGVTTDNLIKLEA